MSCPFFSSPLHWGLLVCISGFSILSSACTPADAPDGGPSVDAGHAPERDAGIPWPDRLPSARDLGMRRGRTIARAAVHLHSPLSHDACDERGWVDGELADPACLDDLRRALCSLHIDSAWLTDHPTHVEEVSREQALWIGQGEASSMDTPIIDASGALLGNLITCDDGHQIRLTAGSEAELMPLGLPRHPGDPGNAQSISDAYSATGPEGVEVFRQAGASVWQAHTEQRSLEMLRSLGIDGLEIYNIHANVDPRIREEHLGLERLSYVPTLFAFNNAGYGMPADLSLLSFLTSNDNALAKWDALLAEGLRLSATGGCDAHQNTFASLMPDGERGDSYRRMMYWVSNHLLVDDLSLPAQRDALEAGRLYVTHEVLGSPLGFDFYASFGDVIAEMGGEAPLGAELTLRMPALPSGWPADPAPILTMRILKASAGGAVEVARGEGESLAFMPTESGAYRAEISMVPEHARPYLSRQTDALVREVTWVYSNAIHILPEASTP